MSRNTTGVATAFLRKMGLRAAVLSIIAGIFGMHVISPAHSAQHQAAAHQQTVSQHRASVHAHAGVPDVAAAWSMEHCSCSGDCPGMKVAPAPCTLSTNTTTLAAPFPGSTWAGVNTDVRAANQATAFWAFHPSSPSPGELSISRT